MIRSFLMFLTGAVLVLSGCSSYYTTIKQTPASGDLKAYKSIYVSWLDLGEGKYKDYGFEENDKSKWISLINEMNTKSLPQYLKEDISKKSVSVAKAKGEAPPADALVVQFADVNYKQQTSSGAQILFGSMAGSDTLDLTVRFLDGKSNKELQSSTISLVSKAGAGYGSMSFEGRVNNTVYNLAAFIAEKTQ